jgi:hypothetical protein
MCCLCRGRQADYTPDPWTERRKAEVRAELREIERAMQPAAKPVNRLRDVFATCTATSTDTSLRWNP